MGTLLVGLLWDDDKLSTGLIWMAQIGVQLLGIAVIGAFSLA